MRKTKIICTIGPASESPKTIKELMLAGMNVARLNFSHGSHEEHQMKVNNIKSLREKLNLPVALLLDTKGPEIRIKTFKENKVHLRKNAEFTLTARDVEGSDKEVSITYAKLPGYLKAGDNILLDDGYITLKVNDVKGPDIICTVVYGGTLSNNKSMNLPGIYIDMPYLNGKDKKDLLFAIENDFEYIALSFVREAEDIAAVRAFLKEHNGEGIDLISKIENMDGVNNIDSLIEASEGIMIARGDMGVEIPFEELPHIQKEIIKKCLKRGRKVITATQMLESMIQHSRPTRAEITDVANAIYDGTSAIMLSGETAAGKFPVESIKTMSKIAVTAETNIDYKRSFVSESKYTVSNVTNAIAHATITTAHDLDAAAIIAVTRSGRTAKTISSFRPATDIIAVTPAKKVYYRLSLSWGVTPFYNEYRETTYQLFSDAIKKVTSAGIVNNNDLIVYSGSSEKAGDITNMLQVHICGETIN